MSGRATEESREAKVENLLFNYSMIIMASFEAAFANLASTMAGTLAKAGTAIADAVMGGLANQSGSGAGEGPEDLEQRTSEQVKDAFAEVRTQARAEFSSREGPMKEMVKNPVAYEGVMIVESFDFGVPRLTERLGDADLAKYMALLEKKDPKFMDMLRQLAEWQKKLPRPSSGEE